LQCGLRGLWIGMRRGCLRWGPCCPCRAGGCGTVRTPGGNAATRPRSDETCAGHQDNPTEPLLLARLIAGQQGNKRIDDRGEQGLRRAAHSSRPPTPAVPVKR